MKDNKRRYIKTCCLIFMCVLAFVIGFFMNAPNLYDVFAADTYTITYHDNDGTRTQESIKYKDITFLTSSKEGYIFRGWYRNWSSTQYITSLSELKKLRDGINGGTVDSTNVRYIMTTDIDLSGETWIPIGTNDYPFAGMFDGQGHIINGLTIQGDPVAFSNIGFFGRIEDAVVANLGFENTNINCVTDGVGFAGAVVATAGSSVISNCYNTGNIKITGQKEQYVAAGGISGMSNDSKIYNCYNTGNIEAYYPTDVDYGYSYAGGITGCFELCVENCYNIGNVKAYSGYDDANAGGITGNIFQFEVKNCFNSGNVSAVGATDSRVGSIGAVRRSFTLCYSLADVEINNKAVEGGNNEIVVSSAEELKQLFKANLPLFDISSWSYDETYPTFRTPKRDDKIIYARGGDTVYNRTPRNKALSAIYEEEYTITYDYKGLKANETDNVVYSEQFELPTVTKEGNRFLGWYNENPAMVVEINTANDLVSFQKNFNSNKYSAPAYILNINKPIYMSGIEWEPIGTSGTPFNGVVYGNGNKINGLQMNNSSYLNAYAGLLGYCKNVEVYDLSLTDLDINIVMKQNYPRFGGIVAYATNVLNIERCCTMGNVEIATSGYGRIGGIVGECVQSSSYSSIRNCYNTANYSIKTVSPMHNYIGMICGYGVKEITNCYNTGELVSLRYTSNTFQTLDSFETGGGAGISGEIHKQYITNVFTTGNINANYGERISPKDRIIYDTATTVGEGSLKYSYYLKGLISKTQSLTSNCSQAIVCENLQQLTANFKANMSKESASYWNFGTLPTLKTSKVENKSSGNYYGQEYAGMGKDVLKYHMLGDVVLTPRWEYNIIYDENGGEEIADDVYIPSSSEQKIKLKTTTKTGYGFVGWEIIENSKTKGSTVSKILASVQSGSSCAEHYLTIPAGDYENITLKAIWGSGSVDFEQLYYNAKQQSPTLTVKIDGETIPESLYDVTGTVSATAVGEYSITITITEGDYLGVVLTAKWDIEYPKITLNAVEEATTNGEEQQIYPKYETKSIFDGKFSSTLKAIKIPTKQHYTFMGWWSKNGTITGDWGTQMLQANGTLTSDFALENPATWYPRFQEEEYTITYDENGGSVVSDLKYTISTDITLSDSPTRLGYTFAGWKLGTSVHNWSANIYEEKQHIGTGKYGDITLVAQWEANKYKIIYNENGGNTITDDSYKFSSNSQKIKLKTTTRTGYAFVGWEIIVNSKTKGSTVSKILIGVQSGGSCAEHYIEIPAGDYEDITLKAIWGSGSVDFEQLYYSGKLQSPILVVKINGETISKSSYEVEGSTRETEVGEYAITITIIEESYLGVVLSTVWDIEYPKVTLNAVENATTNGEAQYIYPKYATKSIFDGKFSSTLKTIKIPTKQHYTFMGWWSENGATTGDWGAQMLLPNATLVGSFALKNPATWYPRFQEGEYTITYDENGGSVVSDLKYTISTDITLSEAPTRIGYNFTGWKLGTSVHNWSANIYEEKQHIGTGKYGDITLVAQWEVKEYTITYDENGGSEVEDKIYTVETDITLSVQPIRNGYVFVGWLQPDYTNATWNRATYDAVQHIGTGRYGNITLVAHWQEIEYTITYDENGGTSVNNLLYTISRNVTLSSKPQRNGYAFVCWKLFENDSNWENKEYLELENVGQGKYGNVTLIAQWQPESYKIYIQQDNGGEVLYDSYVVSQTSQNIELEMPSKTGWSFVAWEILSCSENKQATILNYLIIPAYSYGNVVLKANFARNKYTVTFDANSDNLIGTPVLEYSSKEYAYDMAYEELPKINLDGYIFEGWYTEKTFENQIVESSFVTQTSDYTLYAKWKVIKYDIVAICDENVILSPTGVVKKDYGSSQKFSIAVKKGYTIKSISVDGVLLGNIDIEEYTFENITQNHQISVQSEIKKFIVTIIEEVNSKIVSSKTADVNYGNKFEIKLSDFDYNVLDKILLNDKEVEYKDVFVVEDVSEDITIKIIYKEGLNVSKILNIGLGAVSGCLVIGIGSVLAAKSIKTKRNKKKKKVEVADQKEHCDNIGDVQTKDVDKNVNVETEQKKTDDVQLKQQSESKPLPKRPPPPPPPPPIKK